ncbi:hypothetical protein B296_00005955 [Ensete ventricosum]|uniref:Uncharacterized protein n=1 Tax=Ensete ventricosum TaxID=4639 RepID=A0A426ZLX1_ENSVE|nr:hypothetical protein B296_00005955 [Ensete ventricosum]
METHLDAPIAGTARNESGVDTTRSKKEQTTEPTGGVSSRPIVGSATRSPSVTLRWHDHGEPLSGSKIDLVKSSESVNPVVVFLLWSYLGGGVFYLRLYRSNQLGFKHKCVTEGVELISCYLSVEMEQSHRQLLHLY